MTQLAHLIDRGVIAIAGADRVAFLNGLVSNEVSQAVPGNAVWAALLTAQGRYLVDFFIFSDGDRLLLDTPRALIDALIPKLRRYRLRADVAIEDASDIYAVHAAWDGMPPQIAITAPDPRLREAGFRALSEFPQTTTATAADYAIFRLALGLPDGPPDLEPEKTLLLEAGFNELNGIDWNKGCYMGQELTARTKYRGLVKHRLIPINAELPLPPAGTPILAGGAEVGVIRSHAGAVGLATLRIDALEKPLISGNVLITPRVPNWMKIAARA